MYYFNAVGNPLILGTDIMSPDEAAYATDDPRDPIFRTPPSNKRIRIIDGKLTYVTVEFTKVELLRKNQAYYKAAERSGFKVTGTYRVGSEIVTGHTAVLHLTAKMNSHVQGAVISFNVLMDETPIGLSVNDTDTLLLLNSAQANAVFRTGRDVLIGTDNIRNECEAIIRNSNDHSDAFRQIQLKWQSFGASVNLDTI